MSQPIRSEPWFPIGDRSSVSPRAKSRLPGPDVTQQPTSSPGEPSLLSCAKSNRARHPILLVWTIAYAQAETGGGKASHRRNISDALFVEEQQRIRRERVAAEQRQAELDVDHHELLDHVDIALGLTDRIQAAYCLAEPQTRRIFNQAIFARIWIMQETVADIELAFPFAEVLANDLVRDSLPFRRADS